MIGVRLSNGCGDWWAVMHHRAKNGLRPLGIEPSLNDVKTLENTHVSNSGQPLGQPFVLSDAEFAKVAAAWPTLPDAIRRAIMALVAATG